MVEIAWLYSCVSAADKSHEFSIGKTQEFGSSPFRERNNSKIRELVNVGQLWASCSDCTASLEQADLHEVTSKNGNARNSILPSSVTSAVKNCAVSAIDAALDEMNSMLPSSVTSAVENCAESAIDSALDEMNQLRCMLRPRGYMMKEIEVSLGIVPSLRLTIAIQENASLEEIGDQELTNLQLLVVKALHQKVMIEPALARHKMLLSTLKIDLGLKPLVKLVLKWKSDDDDDTEEDNLSPQEVYTRSLHMT
eukprot:gnl/MRDRNA2_/MRDRNA2_90710_c0_seq1.p1 gnl/MRDRNA2_/MRDRNA2_90710_c0~~gnl/MRDRNA2_/MRDRNA2_90710_c0_seq1.p1  ORF type:complete len:252 (+),score=58.16 gnl/MRDRNA2_/MRDRNA2_90710_c0_seq1:91-846(+)